MVTEGKAEDSSWIVHPDICGRDWQIEYRKLHDSILSGTAPREQRKYVVSVPVRAGGADIMLGMVSFFLYSILTKRAFLHTKLQEEGYHAPILEHAYKPVSFNWIAPAEIRRDISICLWPPYDGTMNDRHCDRSPKPFLPTDTYPSTYFPHFMVNSYNEEYFWKGNYTSMFGAVNSQADVQLFASNRGNVYRTFYNPYHNKTLLDMGFHKETAFACLYNAMFKTKSEVCQDGCATTMENIKHIQKYRRILNKPETDGFRVYSTMIFAIQIRDPSIGGSDNVWFHCVDGLVKDYKAKYGVEDVYYILINGKRQVQLIAQEHYKDRVLFPTGGVLEEDVQDVLNESEKKDANAPSKVRAVMETARDWEVMAQADVHVVSSRSGM